MSDEATRGERLQIMLSPEELTVLDDFRFKVRMPSRAAAVRELLKRGLAAEGYATAAYGTKSADYGVIAKADGHDGADGQQIDGQLDPATIKTRPGTLRRRSEGSAR